MKTRTLLLAGAVLLTAGVLIGTATCAHAGGWDILKAPPGAPDDYNCFVTIDNKPMTCNVALKADDAKRVRIQFNNDDSGHMVLFEGKKTSTVVVTVDAVTVATVVGQPEKVKMTKATGLCTPYNDGYENREVRCQAQTVDGHLFTASIGHTKSATPSGLVPGGGLTPWPVK